MLEKNARRIMDIIRKKDKVLEVGGWAQPFNRANYIVDIQPYETRSFFGSRGGSKEFFNEKTWFVVDACSKKGLPFPDKHFDFVICSHTLEDIRDPIFLCSELLRVGKRWYIEVPSLSSELVKGIADKKYCGYYHHRWLIEIMGNKVIFRHKPHFIHNRWKFHLPYRSFKDMGEEEKVSYLFWDKKFDFEEVIQISRDKTEQYLYDFVKSKKVYSKFSYFIDDLLNKYEDFVVKIRKELFPSRYYHRYMDTPEFIGKP